MKKNAYSHLNPSDRAVFDELLVMPSGHTTTVSALSLVENSSGHLPNIISHMEKSMQKQALDGLSDEPWAY